MTEQSDYYDVRVVSEITYRVVFEAGQWLTPEEATAAFLNNEYQDIVDERDETIIRILSATPLNPQEGDEE